MRKLAIVLVPLLILVLVIGVGCGGDKKDTDGDGWPDAQEQSTGTDPYDIDTDGDGYWDPQDLNPLDANVPIAVATPEPSPTSTSTPTPTSAPRLEHYVNNQFGYSIDYPIDWDRAQISPNEVVIGPRDSEYNQIQIGAFPGEPVLLLLSESLAASFTEAALQQFFDALGATNFNIILNESAEGEWDWMVSFTAIYEDTPLIGWQFIRETASTTYTLLLLQCTGIDWPEGLGAVSSFQLS
jgi:hypothetical protein